MTKVFSYILAGVTFLLILLFAFWTYGYFENGLHGGKFDLGSCWAGVSALTGAGAIAFFKFVVDSVWNSKEGEKPE